MASDINTSLESTDESISNTLPDKYEIYQNYPNPFNPETTIIYKIPKRSNVTLKIYDILGREIKTLINREIESGTHEIKWNGTDNNGMKAANGIYLYKIQADGFSKTMKAILLK